MDQCICPECSRSRQTLEKNVLSWALTGTGSVVFIHQVSPLHPAPLLCVRAHAHFLFLFGAIVFTSRIFGKIFRRLLVLQNCFSPQMWILFNIKCHGITRTTKGYLRADFDQHEHCARCRDKCLGSDLCVQRKVCVLCDNLSDQQ